MADRSKSSRYWESAARALGYAMRFEHEGRSFGLCPFPLPNVWLGTSVEDQARADERRECLKATPAAVRFVSYEPALGPVDWRGWEFIGWLISGGESGPDARPSHPDWHRAARDFCAASGAAYFMKQWGEWKPTGSADVGYAPYRSSCYDAHGRLHTIVNGAVPRDPQPTTRHYFIPVGKKAAGRLLDGKEWNQFPRAAPGGGSERRTS